MRTSTIIYGIVGALVAVPLVIAWKKADATPAPNVERKDVSPRISPYGITGGMSGVVPLVSFPDINGTSANVPMPV